MKKYTWHIAGSVDDFFVKLRSAAETTESFSPFRSGWEGFVLAQKPDDRFILCYNKNSYSNSFRVFFCGKVTQAADGVIVTGDLRMLMPVVIFLWFWFGCVSVIFLALLISPARWALVPGAMLVFGAALCRFGMGLSNPKGIVELLNKIERNEI
jgi:hypothetical protein